MKTYEPMAGDTVNRAAEELVRRAPAEMNFNDVRLVAQPGDVPSKVVGDYWRELERQNAAYRASPKYAEDQRRSEADIGSKQIIVNALTRALDTLDWSDVEAVLRWCWTLQEPADRIGVKVDKDYVILKFRANGYEPGANTGEDFDEGDRDNYARYIIGQALVGIGSVGAPHQMTAVFTERWLKAFGSADTQPGEQP
jgi:hypothetical protein